MYHCSEDIELYGEGFRTIVHRFLALGSQLVMGKLVLEERRKKWTRPV